MDALHKCLFVCLFAWLIALSGCIDVLSSEERTMCLEMTSYAHTSVPVCKTQEGCFAAMEESLGMRDELFSADMRTSLNIYKNYLALSWLHYNHAMENTREIHNICYKAEGLSQLVPQVNELNRNLLNAFAAVDAANRESFTALLIQRQDLEGQDINLVREEPLFNDYANINSNLNLISLADPSEAAAVAGTDSYAGFYLSRTAVFSDAASQLGFPPPKAQRYSAFDLLARYDSQLLKAGPEQAFYMRFAIDAALGLVGYINAMLTLNRAATALEHVPTFQLLNAYNDLSGVGNSAPSRFAELINSSHSHTEELLSRSDALKAEAAENLAELDSAISALDSSAYASFDQNFLANLYSLLGQGSGSEIATAEHRFSELTGFRQHALSEARAMRSVFEVVLQAEARGQITIGEKLSSLKQLSADSALLLGDVHYTSTEAVSNLEVLCAERVSAIEQEINAAMDESGFASGKTSGSKTTAAALEASDLSARLLHRIGNFNSAATSREKLLLCRPIVEDFLLLELVVNDLDSYEHAAGERIMECMDYLHAVFAEYADEFPELAPIYSELLSIPKPYTHPASVIATCESLKTGTDSALAELPEFKELYENHSNSVQMLSALREIALRYPGSVSEPALSTLEKEFLNEDGMFNMGVIDAGALVAEPPGAEAAVAESSELAERLTEEFASALAALLAETAVLELFPKGAAVLNTPFAVNGRVTLDNSIAPYPQEIPVQVPFPKTEAAELVYATPNLAHWRISANTLHLTFSSLPLGKSAAEFYFNTEPATAETDTEITALSTTEALMLQTLALSTPGDIARLIVQAHLAGTAPGAGAENILVHFFGQEQEFKFAQDLAGEQTIEFALNNVRNSDTVEVYYSIPDPILFSAELISIDRPGDVNNATYTYELLLENRLPLRMEKTRIALPHPSEPAMVLSTSLHTQSGAAITVSARPNNTISFIMPALEPGQRTKLSLSITVRDACAYWQMALGQIAVELGVLANSQHGSIRQQATHLLGQLEALMQNFDWQNHAHVQQAQQMAMESQSLIALEQDLSRKETEFSSLSTEIQQKITAAESMADEFEEIGFGAHASSARAALQEARQELESAKQFQLSADYNTGLLHLQSANSILASLPVAGLDEIIGSDRNLLMAAANMLFAETAEFGHAADPNLTTLRDSILEADASVSRALAQHNALEAKRQLGALQQAVGDYNSALAVALEGAAQRALQEIDSFEKILDTCSALSDELGAAIEGADMELLGSSAYTPPLTGGRLSELGLRLKGIESKSLQGGIQEFRRHFAHGGYGGALGTYNGFSAELGRSISAAEKIKKELASALSSLKEDAKSALSKAHTKAKFAEYSAEAERLLGAAADSAEKKRWLKTIVLAENATALMSFATPQTFDAPLAVIPFIALIAAALLLRWHSKRSAAAKKPIKIPRLKLPRLKKPQDAKELGG